MADLSIDSLVRRFGPVEAVSGLSLDVSDGEFVSLLGPSGSGKTTILRLIAGFERPDAGQIRLAGIPIDSIPAHRRGIGMVFQHYALFPHMTVSGNVAFGLRMQRLGQAEIQQRVSDVLEMVRLTGLERRYPRQLSGGQQQRVALARAIVTQPRLLLLDEPLSALDRQLRAQTQAELRSLQKELNLTTLYVTHDQEEALSLSDRVAVIHNGRLQQLATPQQIYECPANPFVADFIGVANILDGTIAPGLGGPIAQVGELRLPLENGVVTPTGASKLSLRPEHIRLLSIKEPGALAANVTGVVYLGTSTHYSVQLVGGPCLAVFVQNTGEQELPSIGSSVWVSWLPKHLRLIHP